MKRTIILLFCLTGWLVGQAQGARATNPFLYDEFQRGQVFFIEGDPVDVKINFNILDRDMQFINPKNNDQILFLVRDPNITHIEIGYDIFVLIDREGWALVVQYGPLSLLRTMRPVRERSRGPYGTPLATSRTQELSHLNMSNLSFVLSLGSGLGSSSAGATVSAAAYSQPLSALPEREGFRIETAYWLTRDFQTYRPATRRNFLRLCPNISPQIEELLSQHRADFNNIEDLQALVRFSNFLLRTGSTE
ncbi:MAG: hypothetical protein FWC94_05205 [Bacteroidales bacterium]|nr:hypothetical protein [Bacteroidales bacterium]